MRHVRPGYDVPTTTGSSGETKRTDAVDLPAEAQPRLATVYAYPGTAAEGAEPSSPPAEPAIESPDKLSSELVEFLELAERRVRAIEQAAAAAVDHVSAELERLLGRLAAGGDADESRLRATGDVVIGHAGTVADWSEGVRRWLESEGAQQREVRPSEGVVLLARRMAVAGLPIRKIEALLAGLGVEDPQVAVRRALEADR